MTSKVLYLEFKKQTDITSLRKLLKRLSIFPGFLSGEILRSHDQSEIFMIQTSWSTQPPNVSFIEDARAWVFEVLT